MTTDKSLRRLQNVRYIAEHVVAPEASEVLLRPNPGNDFIEIDADLFRRVQNEMRSRLVSISAGIDAPTAIDRLIVLLLSDATITVIEPSAPPTK